MRRRLAFWRILAILAVLVAVLALVPRGGVATGSKHIARISIEGLIVADPDRERALSRIAESDKVRALIVRINSPGGTVVGGEALFESLRRIATQKPVVAVLGEVAASGGYLTALGADYIVSRRNSLTGSIGVVTQVPNISELMDTLGIDVTEVKSAPLKAAPSPTTPHDPEAIAALEDVVLDSFRWFRDLVKERRKVEGEALKTVSEGRIFTGHQAKELGLVDAIGSERNAREWLADSHGLSRDLEAIDYRWGETPLPWPLDDVAGAAVRWVGGAGLGVTPDSGPRLIALWSG